MNRGVESLCACGPGDEWGLGRKGANGGGRIELQRRRVEGGIVGQIAGEECGREGSRLAEWWSAAGQAG